jgi:hypothetical protein
VHALVEGFNVALSAEPVEADVAGMQRVLDGSLTSWLNHLKNAAEAAGVAPGGRGGRRCSAHTPPQQSCPLRVCCHKAAP